MTAFHRSALCAICIAALTTGSAGAGDSVPPSTERSAVVTHETPTFSSMYRLRFADAKAVAAYLTRNLPGTRIDADADLGLVTVTGDVATQRRVASTIAQIDVAPPSLGTNPNGAYTIEVVKLKAAIPSNTAGTPSTTAADVATIVAQTLAAIAPDLRISPIPNLPEVIVGGSPATVRLAKAVIARVDVPQQLVVLDTQVVEVNENVASNLGLSLAPNSVLTTTYSETTPQPASNGNTPPLLGLQPLSRTPLSLQFQLGLAIAQGKGRLLADPRITTLSGKTASIRAGDNITVLTQSGGGTGVAVTTQLQTFNTGVTLDITPIVNDDGYVTINLHPVVNNVSSYSTAGIPQISTRDTQTTVGIKEGQTLVIGGLIQDNDTRTTNKIPVLGDLPLVGSLFRNEQVNRTQDELIVTITPHLIDSLATPGMIPFPTPAAVPTNFPFHPSPSPNPRAMRGQAQPAPAPAPTAVPPTTAPNSAALGPITIYGVNPQAFGAAGPLPGPTNPPQAGASPGGAPANPAEGAPPAPLGTLPFALPGGASPSPSPAGSGSPVPQTTPSAFGSTNVFTYGQAPTNNYAGDGDPVQVYYVTFSPTVLANGTNVAVSAITSSNAAKVAVGYQSNVVPLTSLGNGKWQGAYAFSSAGIPSNQTSVSLALTASRKDGTSSAIAIPVTVSPQQ